MTEREQLEQAISALEGQRASLGDAVVETALLSMRARLAEIEAQTTPDKALRKQVTVLFADISGFTSLSETLDAENLTEIIDSIWTQIDRVILLYGGMIDKHMGDAVMALWGAGEVREDDPERAIRAALDMKTALATFCKEHNRVIKLRIGIHTGSVLLGQVGTNREFTAMGDTVNLASRLEGAAPVDEILISHDTYRRVRGVFEVIPQGPMLLKGKTEAVHTYIVRRAKPRAFRMGSRGIEGCETRMIGREKELLVLQNLFKDTITAEKPHMVIVVGEAGIGKSRLLYEFENWIELHPARVYYFKGRATPDLQHIPYGIFRDLFARRFDILESDSATVALEKFCSGMGSVLPPTRADLVGHLIGFDFSASPTVQNLLGSPDFGKLAVGYLTHYVQTMAKTQPMVIFLEDLHWADDSSLALVDHLFSTITHVPLLFVGLTRPTLFERQEKMFPATETPGQMFHLRLELKQLPKEDSRVLVNEILQKVETIPEALCELIVNNAEGNPYYVEELVKMLIEENVILPGDNLHSTWTIQMGRLKQVKIPSTLTGILQSRLDSLPRQEKELLQRAAVVGRQFWDMVVAELADLPVLPARQLLGAACTRELIFERERSAFVGTREYIFKHALLRDVAYETVLLKLRREYHAQVAHWLANHAGERTGEYAGLIAEHLERAGETDRAANYLRQAGSQALAAGALREALGFTQRALALLPEDNQDRAGLLIRAGEALRKLGQYAEARQYVEVGLALAQRNDDEPDCIEAFDMLGWLAIGQGDWLQARASVEQGLVLARKIDERAKLAHLLYTLGWVDIRQGNYPHARESLLEGHALYRELGDRLGLARILLGLGIVADCLEEYPQAQALYLEGLALSCEVGNRLSESAALNNLGEIALVQGDFSAAWKYYQESLKIKREISHKETMAGTISNLGHTAFAMGDYPGALASYYEALQIASEIGNYPDLLEILTGLTEVLASTGQGEKALELLGLVLNHPAVDHVAKTSAETVLASLRAHYAPAEIETGLERGKTLRLEQVVANFLQQASEESR